MRDKIIITALFGILIIALIEIAIITYDLNDYKVKIESQEVQIRSLQTERNHCCLGLEDCHRQLRWEGTLTQLLTPVMQADLDVLSWKLKTERGFK